MRKKNQLLAHLHLWFVGGDEVPNPILTRGAMATDDGGAIVDRLSEELEKRGGHGLSDEYCLWLVS